MQFSEWFTHYLSTYKTDLRPRTASEYRRLFARYIDPVIGKIDVAAITPEDCQAVINRAAAEGGSRSSQAVFALLRAVLRRAVRSRLITWTPTDALDPPKHHAQPGHALTDDDYLTAAPWIADELPLALALFAGLRRGEIAGLQWRDVDLTEQVIHVRRCLQRCDGELIVGAPKSDAGCRDIPISSELLPIIKSEYRLAPHQPITFYCPEHFSRRWRELQRSLRLSRAYRFHDLRHSYITRLVVAGVTPAVVQYLAGHSTINVTMTYYTHIDVSMARRALQSVASYMPAFSAP